MTTVTSIANGAKLIVTGTCNTLVDGTRVPAPRRIWLDCPVCQGDLVTGTYQEINGEETVDWICSRHGRQYVVVTTSVGSAAPAAD